MKAAWVAFSPLLLVVKDNLEPSAQTCLTLQWRINSNTWKQLQHTLSPTQAPVPHRGQTWSWQGLLGTELGMPTMQSFRGNERGLGSISAR